MITGWNITRSLFFNAPRDIQTALVYSALEHRLKLIPKIAESYVAAIAKARNSPNVNPYYISL